MPVMLCLRLTLGRKRESRFSLRLRTCCIQENHQYPQGSGERGVVRIPTEPIKKKLPQARFSWKAVVKCKHSVVGVKKAPFRNIRQAGLEGKSNGLNPVRASSIGDSKDREPENCSVVAFS